MDKVKQNKNTKPKHNNNKQENQKNMNEQRKTQQFPKECFMPSKKPRIMSFHENQSKKGGEVQKKLIIPKFLQDVNGSLLFHHWFLLTMLY